MAEKTLDDLIINIAKRYGNAGQFTVLSNNVDALGLISADIIEPSNYWNNFYVYFLTSPNDGLERLISQQTGNALAWASAINAAPAASSKFWILPKRRDFFLSAINNAIMKAGRDWIDSKETTLDFTVQQEYTLPADLTMIQNIYVGRDQMWQPYTSWEINGVPGSYRLLIRDRPSLPTLPLGTTTGNSLRITYAALPALLTTGSGVTGVGEAAERDLWDFITEMALSLLHVQSMSAALTGEAARGHMSMAQTHQMNAEKAMARRKQEGTVRRTQTRRIPRQVQ
jgi:hypothetical protein